MSDRAKQFLNEWSLKRDNAPISRHEAAVVADRWESEAADNGISSAALRAVAGGDLLAYLLRTYGERPDEPWPGPDAS